MNARTFHLTSLNEQGFTLVEIAIVLVIVGLLLGGLLMPLATQVELQRAQETQKQLTEIKDALIGFALLNQRLPCPATPASDGMEAPLGGGTCTQQHGFVPAVSLGLASPLNSDKLLTDSWNNPIRYSVTAANHPTLGTTTTWDFTTVGDARAVQMANLTPNLQVCTTATGSTPTTCAGAAQTLIANAIAVVFSMGKDWAAFTSADQMENVGGTLGGGPSGVNYPVPNDIVFVSRTTSRLAGNEFDDIVEWIAPSIYYGRMVNGGRLP